MSENFLSAVGGNHGWFEGFSVLLGILKSAKMITKLKPHYDSILICQNVVKVEFKADFYNIGR